MNISVILSIINYAFVLLFGIIVSLYLSDINFSDNKFIYIRTVLIFGLVQIIFYLIMGESTLYKCYPLLIHLPLVLLIHFKFHKSIIISIISVLSAYLLCTPRKWIGTFAAYFFNNNPDISNLVSIVITIPLIIIVIKYISPYIIRLKYESKASLTLFFLLPLAYYILEYALTVYTDLLYTGGSVVPDFMDSFMVVLYFILSMLSLKFSSQRNEVEQENLLLYTTATQAQKEIEQLSLSQKQASVYRHDLRHHLLFLKNCLNEKKFEQASSYIDEICTGLENTKYIKFCDNEFINLIVSSYYEKAVSDDINTKISITAADFSKFQIMDLCSLIANAMENAINASITSSDKSSRFISLKIYEKNNQLCIKLSNNYINEPVFVNGVPISVRQNHGFGTKSMISVIEKYHGIYGFFANNGTFSFQTSLNLMQDV